MILHYLRSDYSRHLDEGWGAFEAGSLEKAEHHFRFVLHHEDDPELSVFERVDAHNGMGAVARAHRDFFDAWRWYKEAEHLLLKEYKHAWPKQLTWDHPNDRPALRTLTGLGHTAYAREDSKTARKYYQTILDHDKRDELGIQAYLTAIRRGKHFLEQ